MGKVICLSNQKGGVAKTYSAWAISNELARRGYNVLAIDGDAQNTLTHDFGIRIDNNDNSLSGLINAELSNIEYSVRDVIINSEYGVDVIPASVNQVSMGNSVLNLNNAPIGGDAVVKNIIATIKDDYDFIFIDCPPTLDKLTINIMTASEEVLIPVNATREATDGLEELMNTINLVQKLSNPEFKICGIIFTMLFSREALRQSFMMQTIELYGQYMHLFKTTIPRYAKAEQAVAMRKPLFVYCKSCPTNTAYEKLVDEFLEQESEA